MIDFPENSEQKREIEQAGVDPAEAGYDEIDLTQHLDGELMASEVQTPAIDPVKKNSLKQKKLAELRRIYNNFEVKDMTFEQFCKEFTAMTDPTKIQEDLASMSLQVATRRSNKIRIDRALRLD